MVQVLIETFHQDPNHRDDTGQGQQHRVLFFTQKTFFFRLPGAANHVVLGVNSAGNGCDNADGVELLEMLIQHKAQVDMPFITTEMAKKGEFTRLLTHAILSGVDPREKPIGRKREQSRFVCLLGKPTHRFVCSLTFHLTPAVL